MSNKKITKSSKDIKTERSNKETICPECKKDTGNLINTVVGKDGKNIAVRQYKCQFPCCGCEYEIEEEFTGSYHYEVGESMWNSGGAQRI